MCSIHKPLVSVIVPAYNHSAYVSKCIESVLGQDYSPVELIVIDDGSTDNTWEMILSTRERLKIDFTALRQKNIGVCKTLNRGISISKGKYITMIASDDYYLPGKIRAQVECFEQSKESVGLVHTSAYLDYQNGTPLEDKTGSYLPAIGCCFDDILSQRVRIIAPSIMFRRTAFDKVGGFDESLGAEDVDFFVRLADANYEFAYLPQPLIVKTVVEGSLGNQWHKLINVHELILEKYKCKISSSHYKKLQSLMYLNLVKSAAGSGEYKLAFDTALERTIADKSISPLSECLKWSLRHTILKSMPMGIRHELRLARSYLIRIVSEYLK